MRAQLVPIDGGASIDIVKDMTLVGRREDVDLRLEHKSVSKLHCVIVKTDGLLLIRDLGSTNGTRVNGQRVRRAALLPNDQVNIANYRFKVQLGPGEVPSPAPALPTDGATQQMDAREVANMLRRAASGKELAPRDPGPPTPAVLPNKLPDLYPDDKKNKE
jgi:pSer/pThr/pTyr-binding forkhead associated (FHA) protein